MMGRKERQFTPLAFLTLEDLVPPDHFYRHLDRMLDLSFVRDLVAPCYAAGGRPSIDPVVFFRLQLVMFCEGIRSERLLMRTLADRLAARWYVGYDLSEPLPDHSSLTKIRQRYGLAVFRRFFDAIVERCQEAGLVWGKELYMDATKVVADASVDSITPRFAVAARAHVEDLFAQDADAGGPPGPCPDGDLLAPPVVIGPCGTADVDAAELAAANASRHDWIAAAGRQDRTRVDPRYQRTADLAVSTTDPDATHLRQRDGVRLGYQDHYLVDGGKARIILEVLVAPAEVPEDYPAYDLLWRACFRWHVWPRQATGDKAYGTLALIRALEEQGVRAYIPLPDYDSRTPLFGKRDFAYDPAHDTYTCPGGTTLAFDRLMKGERLRVYRADPATCTRCPLKERCTESSRGRTVVRSYDEAYIERVHGYHETELYKKALRKRSVWVEPLFAEAKDWHGLRRFRLRRLWRVNTEALLIAAGQNLKRLLSWHGWGRRPWPGGALGLALGATRSSYPRVLVVSWLILSPLTGLETPLAPEESRAPVRAA
jgi:transposase